MAEILAVSVNGLVKTYSARSIPSRSGTARGEGSRGPGRRGRRSSAAPALRPAPFAEVSTTPATLAASAGRAASPDGRIRAVDGLSLGVPVGSVTALLGPNGAGKTTTVEICEGFRRADAGEVRILGRDPIVDAVALRPRVGVMLQAGGMY
ncbi:ATP-binding cassette domain-containing protein, partial [Frankia sp. CpI1-P]